MHLIFCLNCFHRETVEDVKGEEPAVAMEGEEKIVDQTISADITVGSIAESE